MIGAMKASTTILYKYLDSQTEIAISVKKESDFFSLDTNYEK